MLLTMALRKLSMAFWQLVKKVQRQWDAQKWWEVQTTQNLSANETSK